MEELLEMQFGKDAALLPSDVRPIEGYEVPKNEKTGDLLPNCCPFHKQVYEDAINWFNKFPNCCDIHRSFIGKSWFNKNNYTGLPQKIVNQISFTEYHIEKQKDIPDWYKDITDYIEYNIWGFGKPDIGTHIYLSILKSSLQNNDKIEMPKEKKERIIEYIDEYNRPVPNGKNNTNITILNSTYQKWFKIFPFELSYFSNLKQHYENTLPLLKSTPIVNKYTGFAKAELHTRSSLIEALINLTNSILTKINILILHEQGLITDMNKIKLELIINSRKLKLNEGYKNNSKDEETRYRKILKDWFNDEKKFINEITPLLNNENDFDYIKGQIDLEFIPQGNTGYFIIMKGEAKRTFSVEKYFDLDLRNWEFEIDKAITKNEKITIVNNAIFKFRKNLVSETHPLIKSTIEEKILHLQNIIEYINSSFEETSPSPIEPQKLSDIFPNDKSKVDIIKEALKDLSITKDCSDRVISGFVDGCKFAHALPEIPSIKLMRVIFNEIKKPYNKNLKHHTDQPNYSKSWKETKKYFGV
jgi:hypothetical protein